MSVTQNSQAPEGIDLDDVVKGIVRLPEPITKRVDLLRKLYAATEKFENGICIIQGPFRDELFEAFSQRRQEVSGRLGNIRALQQKNSKRASLTFQEAMQEVEDEDELVNIIEETRGDFDALESRLDLFEKKYRKDIEAEVGRTADAAGIAEARKELENTDGGSIPAPEARRMDGPSMN